MKKHLAGLIFFSLLWAPHGYGSGPCDEHLSPQLLTHQSILTNGPEAPSLADLELLDPLVDHIEAQAEQIQASLSRAADEFNSAGNFEVSLLSHYGLSIEVLISYPRLRPKIQKLRAQRVKQLNALRGQHIIKQIRGEATYPWNLTVLARLHELLEIFPKDHHPREDKISEMTAKGRVQYLQQAFKDRILSARQLRAYKKMVKNPVTDQEPSYHRIREALTRFPKKFVWPYWGDLSAEDFANAVLQGYHYVNLRSGITVAHNGADFSPGQLAEHDWAHFLYVTFLLGSEPEVSELSFLKTQLKDFLSREELEFHETQYLLRFFYVFIHDHPRHLLAVLSGLVKGNLTEGDEVLFTENYQSIFNEELPADFMKTVRRFLASIRSVN